MSIFGYSWPPCIELGSKFGDFTLALDGISVRAAEVVYFCHTHWPPTTELSFIDVNMSLPYLVIPGNHKLQDLSKLTIREPWMSCPKTLVGSTCLAVRCKSARVIRLVLPWEYFNMVGWSPSMWATGVPMPSPKLSANLCGNAFSGFAISALISAAISIAGSAFSAVGGASDPATFRR